MLGRVHFEDCQIGLDVLSDEFRFQLGTIVEIDFDFICIGNDMIVRYDETLFSIDDEA